MAALPQDLTMRTWVGYIFVEEGWGHFPSLHKLVSSYERDRTLPKEWGSEPGRPYPIEKPYY